MTSLLGVSSSSFGLRRSSATDPPVPAFLPPSPVSPVSAARSSFSISGSGNGSAGNGASLLFPINPAYTDGAPQGGILLNARRPSDTPEYVPTSQSQVQEPSAIEGLPAGYGHAGSPSPAAFKVQNLPMSPTLSSDGKMYGEPGHYRSDSGETVSTGTGHSTAKATTTTTTRPTHGRQPSSTKIRFAPLPTPNRKRSLSTGRNIVTKAKLEPDGTRTLQRFSKQDGNDPWVSDEEGTSAGRMGESSSAVDDDDEVEDEDDGAEDEGQGKKFGSSLTSSSWMTMGMGKKRTGSITSSSYTYTKKLLKPLSFSGSDDTKTSVDDTGDSGLTFGMPLRKTISTGGLMGNSPFRSSHEQERRRSFLSTGSSKDKDKTRHARNGSTSETPDFSSLSSSLGYKAQTDFAPSAADMPKSDRRPVRMLNGRVYGAKNKQSAANSSTVDPEFSEWGGLMGAKGGGLGSNTPAPKPSAAPAAEKEKRSGFLDDEDDGSGMGWVKRRREQKERERRASELAGPMTTGQEEGPIVGSVPALRVTPPHWPESNSLENGGSLGPEFSSTRPTEATIMEESSIPSTPHEEGSGAVAIKMSRLGTALGTAAPGASDSAVEDESGSESEEDDDEGDFESDTDDEVELDMEGFGAGSRSTSSAAGVEVMIRHHD